jgi:hypothetical protein
MLLLLLVVPPPRCCGVRGAGGSGRRRQARSEFCQQPLGSSFGRLRGRPPATEAANNITMKLLRVGHEGAPAGAAAAANEIRMQCSGAESD